MVKKVEVIEEKKIDKISMERVGVVVNVRGMHKAWVNLERITYGK